MPRYDFACVNGHVRPDVWMSSYRDALGCTTLDITPCEHCGEPLMKQPCAPNFSVKGFSAKNGYSK